MRQGRAALERFITDLLIVSGNRQSALQSGASLESVKSDHRCAGAGLQGEGGQPCTILKGAGAIPVVTDLCDSRRNGHAVQTGTTKECASVNGRKTFPQCQSCERGIIIECIFTYCTQVRRTCESGKRGTTGKYIFSNIKIGISIA